MTKKSNQATNPKKILVATDISAGSDEAFATALDLARQTSAALEIVYVQEIGIAGIPFGLTYCDDGGAITAYIERELARRAQDATTAGVNARTMVLQGVPADEIVRHALNIHADLVVLGTHGRRGLAHALLGSVAERVVQRSEFPVLTVPFANKAA